MNTIDESSSEDEKSNTTLLSSSSSTTNVIEKNVETNQQYQQQNEKSVLGVENLVNNFKKVIVRANFEDSISESQDSMRESASSRQSLINDGTMSNSTSNIRINNNNGKRKNLFQIIDEEEFITPNGNSVEQNKEHSKQIKINSTKKKSNNNGGGSSGSSSGDEESIDTSKNIVRQNKSATKSATTSKNAATSSSTEKSTISSKHDNNSKIIELYNPVTKIYTSIDMNGLCYYYFF